MTAAALVCGSCGAELPANSKFCNECGVAVSAATKPAEYKHVTVLCADVVRRERPENGWAAGASGLDAAVGGRSGRDGVPRADRVRRLRRGAGRRTAGWCGAAASVRPAADAIRFLNFGGYPLTAPVLWLFIDTPFQPPVYPCTMPAVGELLRCTDVRAASASHAAFSASLACCAGSAREQQAEARADRRHDHSTTTSTTGISGSPETLGRMMSQPLLSACCRSGCQCFSVLIHP
jgi:zinc-ribbon domain